jgi:hypothetical protein
MSQKGGFRPCDPEPPFKIVRANGGLRRIAVGQNAMIGPMNGFPDSMDVLTAFKSSTNYTTTISWKIDSGLFVHRVRETM